VVVSLAVNCAETIGLAVAAGVTGSVALRAYKPSRLVAGRVALAGDAAHAASPMVGGGFRQGLYDVRALAQAMAENTRRDEVPAVLARYQGERLAAAIRHVTWSEQETAACLAYAAAR
jgi:2-polyprenyl-6-methoxyphenol hydroxylase-like FAD-dependent oxidoreductase